MLSFDWLVVNVREKPTESARTGNMVSKTTSHVPIVCRGFEGSSARYNIVKCLRKRSSQQNHICYHDDAHPIHPL